MKHIEVEPRDGRYLDEVWTLKERIRRSDGFLRQSWNFFSTSYRKNKSFLLLDPEDTDPSIIGFATVRKDGYILFLGVDPGYRNMGIGKHLVDSVLKENDKATCHTRSNNDDALEFYESLGFQIDHYIDSYYQNGDSAYYLVMHQPKDTKSLKSKIKNAISGSTRTRN